MRTRKTFVWVMFGVLAAFVVLAPHLQATPSSSPSGIDETATVSEGFQQEDQPGLAAGILPADTVQAPTTEVVIQESPEAETASGEPSGIVSGQATGEDSPSDPAAAGIAP